MRKLLAAGLAGVVALSAAGCGSNGGAASGGTGSAANKSAGSEPVTLKITWWGSQSRHDYTQKLLQLYTKSHPNVKFTASPSGWDGYFDKLSTLTASGSMPDIVQMDYLYITTYAKNNSVADLQPFIDDKTIDVSSIDKNVLNTGKVNGKMAGLVLSTSLLAVGYNPDVFAKAGVKTPTGDWTWDDFVSISKAITEKTGKISNVTGPVDDTNIFNYWLRQHGEKLFSDDNKSLGYKDDKVLADFLKLWKGMMDAKTLSNPDEYSQISSLGLEAGPVVTGDAAMTFNWNNYSTLAAKANDKLKIVTPPLASGSDAKGLWLKPGMFFSVAQTSKHQKEAAQFVNWFVNSEEANDVIMAERGTPVSSKIRDHMVSAGKMTQQQKDMFQYVDDAAKIVGETPPPDPAGISEINKAFKDIAYSAFYGKATPEAAAANFRKQANEILARNN
ncbi:MAG: extracellular solute-binding protein [Oscillospiraceae bacterium]|nr:extracellular solute-binding protein [Oscillospiraceae bacterium]